MRRRTPLRIAAALLASIVLAAVGPSQRGASAVHESTNSLVFAPVAGSPSPSATGDGVIEYRGGDVLGSRWTVQLRFRGLEPGATYVAVLQGRFGATGTPEAEAFSPLCTLRSSPAGEGGCWWYLVRMEHVDVVQLRLGSEDGDPVAQATRRDDGPGSIASTPNPFSPAGEPAAASPVASPAGSPAPVASLTVG